MSSLSGIIQSGDWKNEKHVPSIQSPNEVKKDQAFEITVNIGKEISHPNTLEHHIKWIKIFFKPENNKFPIEIANINFNSHGESQLFTDYYASIQAKIQDSGVIYALSYCNIHGLWENSLEITCL
ncbi:MAG: class II SORL domain-containing protein [Eubacteriaceae bacterium]